MTPESDHTPRPHLAQSIGMLLGSYIWSAQFPARLYPECRNLTAESRQHGLGAGQAHATSSSAIPVAESSKLP